MIPKIIHYCWFGENDLPLAASKCIDSWKKYCPDYTIKRWDESNFNIDENIFIKEAYQEKKYAFVSDYARFKILQLEGGIYLDTDVELIRNLDDLLDDNIFMGFEKVNNEITGVAPGLIIGAIPNNNFFDEIIKLYQTMHFMDNENKIIAHSVVFYTTELLKKKGLELYDKEQTIDKIHIYPSSYFCPKDYETGKVQIKKNTYSIHHYDSSWWSPKSLYLKKLTEKYGIGRARLIYRLTYFFKPDIWGNK